MIDNYDLKGTRYASIYSHCIPIQVDLIVCYDACASPTRNIQRMGRTGRHRPGRVVYILHKGAEIDK